MQKGILVPMKFVRMLVVGKPSSIGRVVSDKLRSV